MREFDNIEILPINGSTMDDIYAFNHGPIFPKWKTDNACLRVKYGNYPVDHKPKSSNLKNIPVVNTPLLWCGIIHNHFGHFCAEYSSRILHYKGMGGKLCFSVLSDREKYHKFETLPCWFTQIINFFGFTKNDVYLVTEPIIAKKLYVVPQSENYDQVVPTSDDYLDLLDKNSPPVPPDKKKDIYYISRTGLSHYTGKIAGEKYIEKYLKSIGVNIVKPETLSIKEQLNIYKHAKTLIFAEGSAYHCLQLLGRINCDILIIRRRGLRTEPWYVNVLKPRCKTLTLSNYEGHVNIGLDAMTGWFKDDSYGLCMYTVNCIQQIVDWLREQGHDIEQPDILKQEYDAQVRLDYIEYIYREENKIKKINKPVP
jgi:hypothetical protein